MNAFLSTERAMLLSTPVTLVLMIVEIFITNRYNREYYKIKDTKENFFLGLMYILVDVISKGAGLLLLGVCYTYSVHIAPKPANVWLYWVSLVIVLDFVYWFMHMADHKVRFLWAGHIHHHSSKEFNLSVGLRSAVFEPVEKFVFFAPLALIGYQPMDIILIYILAQGWGTFVHTRTIHKLGFMEWVFTTPSHHRVHHGRNVKYLDKNYGMFLIIWDKIFGTFEPEDPQEPVQFGIVKNIQYKNYADIIFNEYNAIYRDARRNLPLKNKLKYIFGPPGYSHDGSHKTAKEMQQELQANLSLDTNKSVL